MALELHNVIKQVGAQTHIHTTDLAVEDRVFNVLLGTTLSGKTTLLRLMAGLEKPTSGRIIFRGKDVTGVPVQRRNVSMVYQQFVNYPHLTVFENIASPLRVARVSHGEADRRVAEVAELLGLTATLSRRPAELSGGQQQRTALARALVKGADLVLLDEPFANLDYKLREELREELPAMLAETGATIVYATSEPIDALLLGGNTATLHEGRVTHFGPTAEVYRSPRDLRTAQVFADPPLNVADVVKKGDWVSMDGGVRWSATGTARELADGAYVVGLRPYHITPIRTDPAAIEVSTRVLIAEISGSESIVHVEIGSRTWVSQSHGVHTLAIGSTRPMYLRPDRFLFFAKDGALVASGAAGPAQ